MRPVSSWHDIGIGKCSIWRRQRIFLIPAAWLITRLSSVRDEHRQPEANDMIRPEYKETVRNGWCVLLSVLVCGAMVLASCSTRSRVQHAPAPGSGIREYQEIATESANAVRATLGTLQTVVAQSNGCPPGVFNAFSTQVRQMQVASIRLRARAQAIQKRGEAFFENWHESLARVQDPQIRERAQRFRPELQTAFRNIESASHRAAQSYRLFASGLLSLEVDLEQNARSIQTTEARQLIQTTQSEGLQMLDELTVIQAELSRMNDLLRSKESAPHA